MMNFTANGFLSVFNTNFHISAKPYDTWSAAREGRLPTMPATVIQVVPRSLLCCDDSRRTWLPILTGEESFRVYKVYGEG